MKTWRQKLEEIGGYENEMTSVPATAVKEMVVDIELLQAQVDNLTMFITRMLPERGVSRQARKYLIDNDLIKSVLREE